MNSTRIMQQTTIAVALSAMLLPNAARAQYNHNQQQPSQHTPVYTPPPTPAPARPAVTHTQERTSPPAPERPAAPHIERSAAPPSHTSTTPTMPIHSTEGSPAHHMDGNSRAASNHTEPVLRSNPSAAQNPAVKTAIQHPNEPLPRHDDKTQHTDAKTAAGARFGTSQNHFDTNSSVRTARPTSPNGASFASHHPTPTVLHDPARGMTVHSTPNSARTIETRRSDGARVVSLGRSHGFVEHAVVARPGYVARTYLVGNQRFVRVYRQFAFHGIVYDRYVPRLYYHPSFYVWAFNPWPAPIYFAWGWGGAPWYGYYAPYFVTAGVYPTPALWLTDYVLAVNLKLAYENQILAGNAMASDVQATPLSPEVKQLIAEEVRRQLAAERIAAADPKAIPADESAAEAPAALDPAQRIFVVSADLDLPVSAGQTCKLTPGDILLRSGDTVELGGLIGVTVLAAKAGDCTVNTTSSISAVALQEMHNHFREQIDNGLTLLAANQGKALPRSPSPKPRLASNGIAEPDPDVETALLDQQKAADQLEKEAMQSASKDENQ